MQREECKRNRLFGVRSIFATIIVTTLCSNLTTTPDILAFTKNNIEREFEGEACAV